MSSYNFTIIQAKPNEARPEFGLFSAQTMTGSGTSFADAFMACFEKAKEKYGYERVTELCGKSFSNEEHNDLY